MRNVTWKMLVLFAGLLFSPFGFFLPDIPSPLSSKVSACSRRRCCVKVGSAQILCGDNYASVRGMAFKKAVSRAAVNMIILAILTAWPDWSMVPVRMIEIKPDQQKLFHSRASINTAVISIFDRWWWGGVFARKQPTLSSILSLLCLPQSSLDVAVFYWCFILSWLAFICNRWYSHHALHW